LYVFAFTLNASSFEKRAWRRALSPQIAKIHTATMTPGVARPPLGQPAAQALVGVVAAHIVVAVENFPLVRHDRLLNLFGTITDSACARSFPQWNEPSKTPLGLRALAHQRHRRQWRNPHGIDPDYRLGAVLVRRWWILGPSSRSLVKVAFSDILRRRPRQGENIAAQFVAETAPSAPFHVRIIVPPVAD